MRFVVLLQKAKPYTRTRRGKLEQVKGYAGRQKMTALESFFGGGVPKKGWQKEDAEKFVSSLKPLFDKHGYKVEIIGSVSGGKTYKEGHHDLDLKLTHTKPDERASAESIEEEQYGDLGRLLGDIGKRIKSKSEYHEISGDANEPSATIHLKDSRVVDLYEYDPYIEGGLAVKSYYVILDLIKGRSIKEWMEYLKIDEPEKAHRSDNISSIGRSKKDGKWYGWSHRAINGFKTREQAIKFAESVS